MKKYSEEELIEELQRVSKEHCNGGSPRVKDMKKYGNISYATFSNRLGSWNNTLEKVGFNKNSKGRGNTISTKEIIKDIKRVSKEVEAQPSYSDYQKHGEFSLVTIRKYFNSWWNALSECGFKEYKNKDYSKSSNRLAKKDLIKEFNEVGHRLSRIPSRKDINKYSKYSSSVYYSNFSSWGSIVEKSNLNLEYSRKGVEIYKEDALSQLQKAVEEIGIDKPTRDIISETGYSETTYKNKFGSTNEALRKIGYDPLYRRDSPGKEQLIKDIKGIYRCYCDENETPTMGMYRSDGRYTIAWVKNEFASWNNAVKEAGFEPNDIVGEWDIPPSGVDSPNWKGGISDNRYYGQSWRKNKEKVNDRDGCNCRVCGINSKEKYKINPDIHHITPVRYWIIEDEHEKMNHPRNLISLCKPCHHKLEGKFKGRNHEQFEKLAKYHLDIEEVKEKNGIFDY